MKDAREIPDAELYREAIAEARKRTETELDGRNRAQRRAAASDARKAQRKK